MELEKLAEELELPDEKARALIAGLKQINMENWVNLADNVKTIQCFTIFQNWPRLIDIVHDTTDLIARSGFRAIYDVPPGETKHKHLSLVNNTCCMCFTPETEVVSGHNGDIFVDCFENVFSKYSDRTVNAPVNNVWKSGRIVKYPFDGELYNIKLRNGVEFQCTPDHIFLARTQGTVYESDANEKLNRVQPKLKTPPEFGKYIWLPFATQPIDGSGGDYNLGRFIGLFVAEGWMYSNGRYTEFVLNADEYHLQDFITSYVEESGATSWTKSNNIRGNAVSIRVFGKNIPQLIEEYVDGHRHDTKRFKDIIYSMSKEFKEGLLSGIIEGDGYEQGNCYFVELANPELVQDIATLAGGLGYSHSLHKPRNRGGRKPSQSIRISKKRRQKKSNNRQYSHGFTWERVEDMERVPYKGDVYCFEDMGLFQLSSGLVTHNCPTARLSSSIGSHMLLTNIVNKDADVRREWQDIKPFIDEDMPSESQRDFYVEPPKRVVDVYFDNNHTTKTGTGRFYAEFDSMTYDKGEKLVIWFLKQVAMEVVDITTKPKADITGGPSVDFNKPKGNNPNPAPHYTCKYQGKEVRDKKGFLMACYYCQGFYYEKGAYLRHDINSIASAPRWADTRLRIECPPATASPLASELVTEG